MGMAAPQIRLLALTERNNDIGYMMSRISNQKMSLTRDMERVSRKYQDALSTKTLKWSNNGGASYVDLSYNNLMRPSGLNLGKSYAVTDSNGRVVVDSQYKKYAEMISENGAPNGDWESVRSKVLASLLGKNASNIDLYTQYDNSVEESKAEFDTLENDPKRSEHKSGTIIEYFEFLGLDTGDYTGQDIENDKLTGTKDSIKEYLNNLDVLIEKSKGSLSEEDLAKVEENINEIIEKYTELLDGSEENNKKLSKGGIVGYNADNKSAPYYIDLGKLYDEIFAGCMSTNEKGEKVINYLDKTSSEYKNAVAHNADWDRAYQETLDKYNSNVNLKNSILTAEEQTLIEFYDAIFSTIAQKGWTYNNQVNDREYLNQMLQNNSYNLTTISCNKQCDESTSHKVVRSYEQHTDIASNFTNVFIVNDSDAREDALVEYENEKRIINAKETRLDTRMQNLQAEQASIKQMMQSIQKIIGENAQRTFEMFS